MLFDEENYMRHEPLPTVQKKNAILMLKPYSGQDQFRKAKEHVHLI